MTDGRGTFEHAKFAEPRPEHGYCTDDMARVLVVATREPHPRPAVQGLAELSLRFLATRRASTATTATGWTAGAVGRTEPNARGLLGSQHLGARHRRGTQPTSDWLRQVARRPVRARRAGRSPWPRAMAFAAIGAAELLAVAARAHARRAALLTDAAASLPRPAATRRGRGPSRVSPTPTPSCPRR